VKALEDNKYAQHSSDGTLEIPMLNNKDGHDQKMPTATVNKSKAQLEKTKGQSEKSKAQPEKRAGNEMSNYEKRRESNIVENNIFFAGLGLSKEPEKEKIKRPHKKWEGTGEV